ncbi:MAG: hypothetical protein ACT6FF_02385 [Methanosarcinaceae archaeon]
MSNIIEQSAPTRISDANLNLEPRARVYPSPSTWRDQILYFLLPDRFSDGNEDERPLFDRSEPQKYRANKSTWKAGKSFKEGHSRAFRVNWAISKTLV